MFSSFASKPAWYLSISFTLSFLLYSTVRFWLSGQSLNTTDGYPKGLTAIFSTGSIDALNQDPHFHEALLSLTSAVGQSSTDLGTKFGWEHLRSFGTNLTYGVDRIRGEQEPGKKKRDILDEFGTTIEDLIGNRGPVRNSSCGLTNILGCLEGAVTDSLGTPALFLGIGLGMGAATSLNLTDMKEASAIATRVAAAYNTSATGLNLAAQQIGNGMSSEFIPSLGGGNSNNLALSQAAFALASGVGNATAVGLGLRQERAEPSQDSSFVGIAGNFGLGVAMPIVSSMDVRAAIQSWNNSSGASSLMQYLPLLAAAAGNGLGKGARDGFGLKETKKNLSLQKRQSTDGMTDARQWTKAVRLFTKGLSQSFIQGSNFSDLNLAMTTAFSDSLDMPTMLGNIASGAGAGIGMGMAIALDLKTETSTPTISGNVSNDELQTAAMAETFAQNLVSNFFINSSAIEKASQLVSNKTPQMVQGFDAAKAAEGLGRGTIEGIMIAMSSVGGLKNLISGDVPADAINKIPALAPTQFNDSVSGAAVGFARGLSGKATILVADIARNLTNGTQTPNKSVPVRKRSTRDEDTGTGIDEPNALLPRQAQLPNGNQLPLAIDPATAQISAQKLVDTLTCQGVGGIVSAAMGFASTSPSDIKSLETSMGESGVSLDPTVLQVLPKGPITVTSAGNSFEIVLETRSIKVNGLELAFFVTLTGLHVLFTTLAFLIFLPLYLIFGVAWRFSVIAGHPVNEAKNRKWRMGFLITFAVFGSSGIILGIVGMGNASHFSGVHGILGLVCLVILIPTVGSSIVRLRTTVPHPSPSAFSGPRGAIALLKSPQRIYFISGFSVQLILILGQIAFVQGFTVLRTISLCVVDAFFTSDSTAGLVGMLLFIQISAGALVGLRNWLEQHIAKKEAGEGSRPPKPGLFKRGRTDTIATFGFDKKDTPPPLDIPGTRGSDFSRKTEELKGFEDNAIGTPFNFRKEGSINEQEIGGKKMNEDVTPFHSIEERNYYEDRGIYNPKTGGYAPYQTNGDFYDSQPTLGERRPSSGIFDAQLSPQPPIVPTGPKTTNVSTMDLWPPLMPDSERLMMTQKTQKTVSSRYSRPIDGNIPVRDSFMGFGA